VTSDAAALSLDELSAVSIAVAGPTSVCTTCTAGTATVTDAGGGAVTHQWGYRTVSNGAVTPIAGETGATYVIAGAHFPGPGTYYLVETTTPECGPVLVSNEITVVVGVQLDVSVWGDDPWLIGPGLGTVTLAPADHAGSFSCTNIPSGANLCSFFYDADVLVTLTATPEPMHSFVTWDGACLGEPSNVCTVTMSEALWVEAQFQGPVPLTVDVWGLDPWLVGPGRGTVTVTPDLAADFSCDNLTFNPNLCEFQYEQDTLVTLTATAEPGHVFAGWGGDCWGELTNVCTLTLSTAGPVLATFSSPVPLSVTVTGVTGEQGTVNLSPPDLATASSCDNLALDPNTCAFTYTPDTVVTLTATAEPGGVFLGWSGACAGTAPTCDVTMSTLQDVTATFGQPPPVPVLTARATDGRSYLEWVNPDVSAYSQTHVLVKSVTAPAPCDFPTDPGDVSATLLAVQAGSTGTYDFFDHTGLGNTNTTYCYGVFAEMTPGLFTAGRFVAARPFGLPVDLDTEVQWAFSTGATAMAPPGIGGPGVYAPSNDRNLYAVQRGTAGGTWVPGYLPFTMGAPAQDRPPVVPTAAVPGASRVAFLGSQDGHVYAVDALTGAQLWRTTAPLGDMIQAGPAGMFTRFGGLVDYVFVGTRNSVGPNVFYALNAADGSVAATFDNGGGATGIGIISGTATVQYGVTPRVCFASRALVGGSSNTLWCLDIAVGSLSLAWAEAAGDIEGAPILKGDRIYVGTNGGDVKAYSAVSGTPLWTFVGADGPIKGAVLTDLWSNNLYFSTNTKVWGIRDDGPSASQTWETTGIAGPSIPLYLSGGTLVWVGSSDGNLYQLDFSAAGPPPGGPPPTLTSAVLGDGAAVVGSPSYDVVNGIIQVGTDAGIVYAVTAPIP